MTPYVPGGVGAVNSGDGFEYVVKEAAESVTSSTTIQDDDELSVALEAGTYVVEMFLATSAHASGGFKNAWAAITGSTAYRRSSVQTTTQNTNAGLTTEIGATNATSSVKEEMILILTQAGTLTLRWAQNASNGTATQVLAGSFFRYKKTA